MVDRARSLALDVLRRVATEGAFAGTVLRGALPADADERDRGLVTELVYGVLRRRAQLDKSLSRGGKRLKDVDPRLHDVLRLGAYQLMFLERVPDHAAVSTSVELARGRGGERAAGLVNALLRRIAERTPDDRHVAPADRARDPVQHVADVGSLPRVIAELWIAALGLDRAARAAAASLERAPLVLRTNLRRGTRDALVDALEGASPGHHPLAVHLPDKLGRLPAELAPVADGRATPQDEGSMAVIDLLDPQPGERVLDLCAAPGGKTTAIAERIGDGGKVVAYDRAIEKLPGIARSAARLGLAQVEVSEVPPEGHFDRVLVDAPCSGLGTLRRHPEIRWRFRADDLTRLTRIQGDVLARGASAVRPGGVLVYSVCTTTHAEGPAQLEAQADALAGFRLVEQRFTEPSEPGAPDGFFMARLERR